MVVHTCHPSTWRLRQEDHELEVSLELEESSSDPQVMPTKTKAAPESIGQTALTGGNLARRTGAGHPTVWSLCVLSALMSRSTEGLGRGWVYGVAGRWTSMSKSHALGLFSDATLNIDQRNDCPIF